MEKFNFEFPLTEALIKSRPNRFIMFIEIDRKLEKAHCPVTGRIGNLVFKDIPCLVSRSNNEKRKTKYTVEAISLDPSEKKDKSWVGINQTNVNRYIEFLFKNKQLERIAQGNKINREVSIGKSRIDFQIDNNLVEVKMPLISFNMKTNEVPSKFTSFDRLIKHFNELARSLKKNSRAIVINCYIYDAPPFSPPKIKETSKIQQAARKAINNGVELWQVNLRIDKKGIQLIKYFKLNLFN